MAGGRPMKWETVKDIEPLIEAYFSDTKQDDWTITGLAIALDTSRSTLIDYEWNDEFSNTIKKAKDKIEYWYELDLKHKGNSGNIFALKNFWWVDKQEVDQRNLNIDTTPKELAEMSDEELQALLK
jgi:DNA-packaging protein gp3